MILVSACLLGMKTRYDGNANASDILMKYMHLGKYLPVCPEQLGGLSTPRLPAEIVDGMGKNVLQKKTSIKDSTGQDITDEFIKGAEQVLYIAQSVPISAAILKEKSPSCGVHKVYDGTFNKVLKDGMGITTALLRNNNIPVYSEEEITEQLLQKLLEL